MTARPEARTAHDQDAQQSDNLLKLSDVMKKTRFGKSTIYRKINAGTFPRAYDSGNGVRWKESEIIAWMRSLVQTAKAS